jgi:2-phosphosulfolactate phosphatase
MIIDVFFSPVEVHESSVERRAAVVIDVIRATSVMVEALANGARGIFPTVSTDEAARLASSLGREDTLLCGERRGLRVEGFDLGNSPSEFAAEVVKGKQLVMSTTNGTRALLAAEDADRVLVASFLNLSAVAGALGGEPSLAILCAGREDRFSLDDALCAGFLIGRLLDGREGEAVLNDAARVARELARAFSADADFLRSTDAGAALVAIGLEADLELCAALDRHALVPEMRERRVALAERKNGK